MRLRNKSVNHYAAAYVAGVYVWGGGRGRGMSAITKQTNTLVGINLVDIPETVSSRSTIGSPTFLQLNSRYQKQPSVECPETWF